MPDDFADAPGPGTRAFVGLGWRRLAVVAAVVCVAVLAVAITLISNRGSTSSAAGGAVSAPAIPSGSSNTAPSNPAPPSTGSPNSEPASDMPSSGGGAGDGSLTKREVAIALAVAHAQADRATRVTTPVDDTGWPAIVQSVSAQVVPGTVTQSNTGHECLSGTIIQVKLIGTFMVVTGGPGVRPAGNPPASDSPDSDLNAFFMKADLDTGQVCLMGVEVGEPTPDPGATVLYHR